MKNKGFTLMELLGVVVIIGVLALVVFPPFLKQINKAKEGISEATKVLIIDASKDYFDDYKQDYEKIDGVSYCIPISTLVEKNYLNDKLKDDDLNDLDQTKQVKMTYLNNGFNYEVVDECVYSMLRNGVEVPIVSLPNDGLYLSDLDEGRFLYRGKEPHNYLILPEKGVDTLYRIISYENDGTIKVIREERIGNLNIQWDSNNTLVKNPWTNVDFAESEQIITRYNTENNKYCNNTYGCNVWGTQNNTYYEGKTLNELYNSFHYKWYSSNDTTTLNPTSPHLTATVNQEASLNILLNREWLSEVGLEQYIDNHEFNVSGVYPNSKNLLTEKKEQALYKWIGKVGLMYITDMVESSTNPDCTSVYSGVSDESPCKNTIENTDYGNWMQKSVYHEWTLSACSSFNSDVWFVNSDGHFGNRGTHKTYYGVRPAFFLKSSVVLTGEGTEDSPYRIK